MKYKSIIGSNDPGEPDAEQRAEDTDPFAPVSTDPLREALELIATGQCARQHAGHVDTCRQSGIARSMWCAPCIALQALGR